MALSGAQGKFAQAAWGFEASPGVMASSWNFVRVKSIEALPEIPLVPTENMNPRGQKLEPFNLEKRLPFKFSFQPTVNELMRLRLHMRGYGTLANPTTGVYVSTLREFETGDTPVSGIDTLSFEFDRDDGVALLLLGCVLTEMAFKVEHGKFVECTVSGMAARYTYQNDAVETSVNAAFSTSRLLTRGRAAADYTIKATTGGALDGTAEVKVSEDGSYGGAAIPVTAGSWIDAVGDDDDPSTISDDVYDPAQFMITSGGALTLDDLFTIDSERTKMSPTYVAQNPLSGVGATLKIGGTSYNAMNFDVVFRRPYDEDRAVGSKYTSGFVEGEFVEWEIQLVRKYTSRALLALLEAGSSATVDVDIYGDRIAATAYRERLRFYWAAAKFDSAGTNVTSAGALEETVVLMPYDNESDSTCVETINHTLSALVA